MNVDNLIDAIGLIDDKAIQVKEQENKRYIFTRKRLVALAAAVLLCFTAAVPALAAADVEPAYKLLYAVLPAAAQSLKPVKECCVDNGIQMEVVSACIDGDTAQVFIAMKDLEGSRIDATTDLFDSYDIRNSLDNSGTCKFEGFDEKTGTATFCIYIKQHENAAFTGDGDEKITFTVSEFLSGKTIYNGELEDVDLSDANAEPQVLNNVDIRGNDIESSPVKAFLKPSEQLTGLPAEGAYLSAIGYIDNKLHVQLYFEDIINTDNHGDVKLMADDGSFVTCCDTECFWDENRKGSYQEYVYDISVGQVSAYSLYAELVTCNQLTRGQWQVTFPLSKVRQMPEG